jgi:hypothetical protein
VQFLAPVVISWVAMRTSFGAGIAPRTFALLAGATVDAAGNQRRPSYV